MGGHEEENITINDLMPRKAEQKLKQKQIGEFEHLYDAEFERYVEENKKDTVWNTAKKYPMRNLILMALAYKSYQAFGQAVANLSTSRLSIDVRAEAGAELPMQLHSLIVLTTAVFLGYFLADLITGFIHLVCDNVPLQLKTMASGRSFLEYAAFGLFHYHHIHPTDWNHNNLYFAAILRAGFQFYVPMTLLALLAVSSDSNPFVQIVLLICSHTGLFVQLSHAASHGRFQGNRWVAFLQNHSIILHPSIHKIHHQEFNQNYAILNGYSNGALNLIYRHLVQPYTPTSVSAETQKKLYYEKEVSVSVGNAKTCQCHPDNGNSNGEANGRTTKKATTFDVRSIKPHYVIFPDYRKHKGCPI